MKPLFPSADPSGMSMSEKLDGHRAEATPSDEGRQRYPESNPPGFYIANGEPGTPCTCTPECDSACKGKCGCRACHEAYQDTIGDRE